MQVHYRVFRICSNPSYWPTGAPPHGSVPFLLRTVVGDRLCLAERAKTEYEMQSMSPDQAEAYTARNGGRWDEAANTVTDMAEHLNSLQNVLMEAVL